MRIAFKSLASAVALAAALLMPAAVVAQSLIPLTLTATAGAFTGKWVYRSFSVSGDLNDTLAELSLGLNELTLTEDGGRVVGTRTGQGINYELAGTALYAARQGATIRLHGTATISGKTYDYDYFGYLIPKWDLGVAQTDTIMGTVLRTDPASPTSAPILASFTATRQ